MRIGVPLVPGMDPVAIAMLDRIVAQANLELTLRGDDRQIDIVRLAADPGLVMLQGGMRVRPDALYEERPGLDVVYLAGSWTDDSLALTDTAALADWLAHAKTDAQHLVAVGGGVTLLLETHLATARRVMISHLSPQLRARFDSVIATREDPCRDGNLWTTSNPLHAGVLVLGLIEDMLGRDVRLGVELRTPWLTTLRTALEPPEPSTLDDDADEDDDEGGGGDGLRIRPGPTTGY